MHLPLYARAQVDSALARSPLALYRLAPSLVPFKAGTKVPGYRPERTIADFVLGLPNAVHGAAGKGAKEPEEEEVEVEEGEEEEGEGPRLVRLVLDRHAEEDKVPFVVEPADKVGYACDVPRLVGR